jgi:hypothetical protein
MKRRGICYDVGRVLDGTPIPADWRPQFAPAETHRELQIIRDDLHCNAVRICGRDLDRLMIASVDALALGLEVWFSPELWNDGPDETLDYIGDAARRAAELNRDWPGRVVFSVGSELTLFMRGIVEGDSLFERMASPTFWETVRSGAHNTPLNAFLSRAAAVVRQAYRGPITYASVPFEAVDWSPFDIVSVDLYRDARLRDRFDEVLRRYFRHDRPVAITEFGCCTFRGAADAGGQGFMIIDTTSVPPRLKGVYVRDEAEQAAELSEDLRIFDAAGVDATFVFTFVAPTSPTSDDPLYDLDMASYALVKSYGNRLGDLATRFPDAPWDPIRSGTTYPDMPWEPKLAFGAVANFYEGRSQREPGVQPV